MWLSHVQLAGFAFRRAQLRSPSPGLSARALHTACVRASAFDTWIGDASGTSDPVERAGRPSGEPVELAALAAYLAKRVTDHRSRATTGQPRDLSPTPDANRLRFTANLLTEADLASLRTPQLVQLLRACAMIKSVDQIVFKRVSKALRTEAHLASMDAGGLAVVAFAFASAGVRAPFLFDALAKRICPPHASGMAAAAFVGAACIDLTRISPGQLSKLSWSYTRLHAHTPALFAAVAHAAAPRLSEFAPADLVSLCYGVAASGYAARPLCAELLGRAAELLCAGRLAACSRSDLAVLASAFMRSCLPAERARVLRAISDELTRTDVPEKLSAMQPRELAELLFAYALSGEGTRAYASPLMRALVKEASARNAEAFKMDQRCQLFRATSVLNLEAPGLLLKLPSHLERAPIIDRDKDVGPRALSTELKALGVVHTCEFRVPGTPFVVDIALTEARAVIELQGFHSHLQRRASDECKARVLRGLGWQVVGLNSQHCAKLGKAGLLDRLARLIKEGSAPGAHVQWGLLPDRLLELLGRNIPPSS